MNRVGKRMRRRNERSRTEGRLAVIFIYEASLSSPTNLRATARLSPCADDSDEVSTLRHASSEPFRALLTHGAGIFRARLPTVYTYCQEKNFFQI